MIEAYLETIGLDANTKKVISAYMEFIGRRASGELKTAAQWMRSFVANHPEYKQDSEVTSGIAYDLIVECQKIGEGLKKCPEMFGDYEIRKMPDPETLYNKPLEAKRKKDPECKEKVGTIPFPFPLH